MEEIDEESMREMAKRKANRLCLDFPGVDTYVGICKGSSSIYREMIVFIYLLFLRKYSLISSV